MKNKVIAHVDGNNFFVGCEILMNPSLKGKPVCVLSNNDGCIVSRSYEAKKLGIKMGLPFFMAKRDFKGVTYISANFTLYHELSQRMMIFLRKYSDKIEAYSIDEAFLDITGFDKIFGLSFIELARKIKEDIQNQIGIEVSVGVSSSKTLAKIATHKAKSDKGFYFIDKNSISEVLSDLKVEEIWGIGKNTARTLRKFGIFFGSEICTKNDDFYKKYFGKKGMELKYELMGESVIPLNFEEEIPKSIQRTRAFTSFSKDKNYIKTELGMHLHNVCKKLRENDLKTSLIAVMLRTKEFKVFVKEKKLETPLNSEISLIKIVNELFEDMYSEDITYRSSGIWALNLNNNGQIQLNLSEESIRQKEKKVSLILDKIENKYGKGSLVLGDMGIKNVANKHKREINICSI